MHSINSTLGLNWLNCFVLQALLVLQESSRRITVWKSMFIICIHFWPFVTLTGNSKTEAFIQNDYVLWESNHDLVHPQRWSELTITVNTADSAVKNKNKDAPLHYSFNSRSYTRHWFTCVYINNHFHTCSTTSPLCALSQLICSNTIHPSTVWQCDRRAKNRCCNLL